MWTLNNRLPMGERNCSWCDKTILQGASMRVFPNLDERCYTNARCYKVTNCVLLERWDFVLITTITVELKVVLGTE